MADELSPFISGWNPERVEAAQTAARARGFLVEYPHADPIVELPASFSLKQYVKYPRNQGQAGTCFPPGTRVRMADGSERNIESVRLLDEVVTAEGNIGVVRNLMVRKHDEPVVNLQLWGHSHLRMTAEHPVLTDRGYIAAKDLAIDDFVAMPRYAANQNKIISSADHVVIGRRRVNRDRSRVCSVVGRTAIAINVKAVPDFIEMTPGVGHIFGLFLAEGSTDTAKIVWTFADHEESTLAAELVRLLKQEWDVEARVKVQENKHVCRVFLYGTHWAKMFESLFSSGAGKKRLHPDITSGPEDFLSELFDGWMEGDGCEKKNGGMVGTSISKDLALGMYDIAQSLGLRPSILREEAQKNEYAKTRQPVWKVACLSASDNYRVKLDEKHCWRKVRGIVMEDYDGHVYNLSVEGDESYVAEGIGVHNCWAHSATQIAMILSAVEASHGDSIEVPNLSPRFTGYYGKVIEGGGNPSDGGTVTDAMMAISDNAGGMGCCHESLCPYSDSRGVLATKPPAGAITDAKVNRIHAIANVALGDAVKQEIYCGRPVALGIWWPNAWGMPNATFFDQFGGGSYGHALVFIGWYTDKSGKSWWQIENSWDQIYKPLPSDVASTIPGYPVTDKLVSDFYGSSDGLLSIQSKGNAEFVAATSVSGFPVTPIIPSFDTVID